MTSPRLNARLAGLFYFLAVLTAITGEFLAPGRLGIAAVAVPVSCYVVVTLLLYAIFQPVSRSFAALATVCGVVGLTFEALQWQPWHINLAMVFHGVYCLLIGYLAMKSSFLPRVLGALMGLAGLVWLMYLSATMADSLSPFNTIVGLIGEAALMLWLLVAGVNVPRWKQESAVQRLRMQRGFDEERKIA